MDDELLYKVEHIATLLRVHAETVRGWIRSGELVAIDLGGRAGYRISQAALDEFLKKRQGVRKDD